MSLHGTWDLEVSTPFGRHPATLVIERARGGVIRGRIDSRLGSAALSRINLTPAGFDATISLEVRGKVYEALVSAAVNDDRIDGKISVKLPMAPPLRFTGTRAG